MVHYFNSLFAEIILVKATVQALSLARVDPRFVQTVLSNHRLSLNQSICRQLFVRFLLL